MAIVEDPQRHAESDAAEPLVQLAESAAVTGSHAGDQFCIVAFVGHARIIAGAYRSSSSR
jgi:hypothetical protein